VGFQDQKNDTRGVENEKGGKKQWEGEKKGNLI
jgi:hypothetical protein